MSLQTTLNEATRTIPTTDETGWGNTHTALINDICLSIGDSGVDIRRPPYSAKGDGSTNDTAAIQAAHDAALAKSRNPLIYIPPGEYMVDQILYERARRARFVGAGRLISTFRQRSQVSAGTHLLTPKSGSGQEGPQFQSMTLQGHANGGHNLHLDNLKGAHISDVFFLGGAASHAQIRATRTIKLLVENCRFRGNTQGHGVWLGDAADDFPETTNNWFVNCYSFNDGENEGYPNGHVFLIDNGSLAIRDSKFDSLECPESAFKALGKVGSAAGVLFCLLDNVNWEFAGTGPAGRVNYHLENAQGFFAIRSNAGHETKCPKALKLIRTRLVQWERGFVFGGANAVDVDVDCDDIVFNRSQFGDGALFTGFGVTPQKVKTTGCTRISNSNYNILDDYELSVSTELLISAGIVTIPERVGKEGIFTIDTEADAATDDLDTISGAAFVGQKLILSAADSARTVVMKDGTGNLKLNVTDFSLDNEEDSIVLIWRGSYWAELSRSDNGA